VSVVEAALAAAAALALAGALAAVLFGRSIRAAAVGGATALSGAAAVVAGVAAVTGADWYRAVPHLLPLTGIELSVDALSGWFLALVGAVTFVAGLYTIGYAGRGGQGPGSRPALFLLPVFTASMMLVPVAATVPTLLFGWELMAVTSLLLVLTEHRHQDAVREAGVWYASMTQAGFAALLVGLLWLAAATGGGSFAAIRAGAGSLDAVTAGAVFMLAVVGFASKAGAVPLHPWLPRAHAESPSHVSMLMSAAMVKLGIYGILRLGFDLLDGGAMWWWLVIAVVGGASALYGIMQAALARDIKRMLAFSTSENVGLILLGVGFAGLYDQAGNPTSAVLALAAALLHTANHAAFKAALFGGAGSVVRATGIRDLDRLGGLVRTMPATTALFAGAALAAAALPPGNGFVSEWLLLQSLVHPGPDAGTMLTIGAPAAVAVVAATAGIGVMTYVKTVGTGFLARPRSDAAAASRESPPTMIVAMVVAATACVVLALVPGAMGPSLSRVAGDLGLAASPPGGASAGATDQLLALRVGAVPATFWPLWTALGIVTLTVGVALAARVRGRARRRAAAWDCGDGPLTSRMEYTATSFAEPLQRVFDNVLAPEQDVDVSHVSESRYHVAAVTYQQRIPDRIENRLYRPLLAAIRGIGERARALANGSVHRYLGYMLTALLAVLVAGVLR
jgi:formate hydrogenlyase subunit 3/multisubunit Na+/H+ antiporter MnhD subunit